MPQLSRPESRPPHRHRSEKPLCLTRSADARPGSARDHGVVQGGSDDDLEYSVGREGVAEIEPPDWAVELAPANFLLDP
jgi:hypothetical protein